MFTHWKRVLLRLNSIAEFCDAMPNFVVFYVVRHYRGIPPITMIYKLSSLRRLCRSEARTCAPLTRNVLWIGLTQLSVLLYLLSVSFGRARSNVVQHGTCYRIVCLSVCLSHSWVAPIRGSKYRNTLQPYDSEMSFSCSQISHFRMQGSSRESVKQKQPLSTVNIRPITRHISKTVQDSK